MVEVLLQLLKTNPPIQGKRLFWPREFTSKPVRVVGPTTGVGDNSEKTARVECVPPHPVSSSQTVAEPSRSTPQELPEEDLSCLLQSVTFQPMAVRIESSIMGYRLFNWVSSSCS